MPPPPRRGPAPRFCRPSHKQRAYEARRRGSQHNGPTQRVTVTTIETGADPPSSRPTRLRPSSSSTTAASLDAALATAQSAPSQLGSLRAAVDALATALGDTVEDLGLPVIAAEDEARWALVEPVSRALRAAADTLAERTRSTRRLDNVRRNLVAAAVAIKDPETARRTSYTRITRLPVVVPGPDGTVPSGVIDCDLEAGTRTVRWYPDGWKREGELLSVVAGRPTGFRYRWQDRRVWDMLALDLIILCCGWRTDPAALPPALKRSQVWLGNQLRSDISVGTWALQPSDVVRLLESAGLVRMYRDTPEAEPVT